MNNHKKGQASIIGVVALLIIVGAFIFAYGLMLSASNSSLGQPFIIFGIALLAVGLMVMGVLGKA